MLDAFHELVADLRLNHKRSPWAKKAGVRGWTEKLAGEVKEAQDALAAGDMEHFKEEMGDVMWCWLGTMIAAEFEPRGTGTIANVLRFARLKIHQRKPWIFDPLFADFENAEDESRAYAERKKWLASPSRTVVK